jgi:hypothetical protein
VGVIFDLGVYGLVLQFGAIFFFDLRGTLAIEIFLFSFALVKP